MIWQRNVRMARASFEKKNERVREFRVALGIGRKRKTRRIDYIPGEQRPGVVLKLLLVLWNKPTHHAHAMRARRILVEPRRRHLMDVSDDDVHARIDRQMRPTTIAA